MMAVSPETAVENQSAGLPPGVDSSAVIDLNQQSEKEPGDIDIVVPPLPSAGQPELSEDEVLLEDGDASSDDLSPEFRGNRAQQFNILNEISDTTEGHSSKNSWGRQDWTGFQQSVKIKMFEFKQNDPKMDTGMKLVRFGIAQAMNATSSQHRKNSNVRGDKTFHGLLLSSESTTVVSPADRNLILQSGIGGINCSWNQYFIY